MIYDSDEWRKFRNRRLRDWVLDRNAVSFLLDIFQIAEVWDAVIDKDDIPETEVNRAFQSAIFMPTNPFYMNNFVALQSVMVAGINAWLDSVKLEKENNMTAKAQAYVLRDWYMELINVVIHITRGYGTMRQLSLEIREFFTKHESFENYLGEKK